MFLRLVGDDVDDLRAELELPELVGGEEARAGEVGFVAKRAIELKTGARALRAILEKIMLEVMYDLPHREDVTEVVIDQAVVEGRRKPQLKKPGQAKSDKNAA